MVLVFPVIPILVLLYWLFRWLSNRGTVPEAVVPKPAPAAPFTESRLSFGHLLLFAMFYLPGAILPAMSIGEASGSGWLGLLAFAASFFGIFMGPRWLAWRVLGPLGLVAVGRIVLWLAPSVTLRTFRGNLELFSAAFGGDPRPKRWTASPWFLFTRAIRSDRSDREGDPGRVEALLELLSGISPGQLPWRLRRQGIELLAWPAVRSGHWQEALRRLESGRGRGVRLLRMLAAAHTGNAVSSRRLWLAWLLAPGRRQTRPLVFAALDPSPAREDSPPPLDSKGVVWLRHLRLLEAAAEGRAVRFEDVEAVAEGWERVLGKAGQMSLLARGAELEVPDVQAVVSTLRPGLQAELEAVTDCVEGHWPEPRRRNGLAAQVRRRRFDRLFAAVQVEVDPFLGRDGFKRTLEPPLQELERWLQFRLDLQRLLAASGDHALPTAWYNGLRIAACNWPVFLLRTYGTEVHWACRQMFRWSEAQALKVGDQDIAQLSHRNLREVRTFLT